MGTILRGARVLSPEDGLDGVYDILIEGGRIKRVAERVEDAEHEVVELQGKLLTPGLIDLHVHLREPGAEHKETIETGAWAALAGGFTTIVSMPNTEPPIDTPEMVRFVLERAEEAGGARVLPAGAITKGRRGEELAELALMAEAGAVAFTDDGSWIQNSGVMRRALEYSLSIGRPLFSHPEDRGLSEGGYAHWGPTALKLGMEGVPREAEEVAVYRDLALAELTGARLHLQHLSSAGSAALVRIAKASGVPITAEVTPHHLLFNEGVLQSFDTNYKVNPPIREESDRQALLKGLLDGTVDAIATDHAPHSWLDKSLEFPYAPPGIAWLEIAFPALYTLLVLKGELPLETLVKAMTSGPARVLGTDEIGRIREGAIADLVAWDLEAEWEAQFSYSKSRNNPLLGQPLKGRVFKVWKEGKEVAF